eukprot:m.934761 g.934761  ORF g.934761 m.934761 type:complete len:71 (-) comp207959_c0_seq1:120-332(-)
MMERAVQCREAQASSKSRQQAQPQALHLPQTTQMGGVFLDLAKQQQDESRAFWPRISPYRGSELTWLSAG